jgi:hypothetical protein
MWQKGQSRGRDKPAPSYPGDEENLKMPTKCRRSRLFAGPQAGIGQGNPALTLTPSQSSRLEIGLYNYRVSHIHKIKTTYISVHDSVYMLLHNLHMHTSMHVLNLPCNLKAPVKPPETRIPRDRDVLQPAARCGSAPPVLCAGEFL